MRQFLIRRLIQSALLLWVLMTFTFALTRLTPGGPESALLGQPNIDRIDLERLRERFGLNDPLPVAYGKWLSSAVRLDFGRSYHYLRPPLEVIWERLGPTVQLGAVAYGIAMLGIPLGVVAAFHRGKLPDMSIRVFTVFGGAVPSWWLALVIIVALSALVGWFPYGLGREGPIDWFTHIIIPGLILGLAGTVTFTRFVRSQVLEVLEQDYVRTARAKGLKELLVVVRRGRGGIPYFHGGVIGRHILRNALLPVVTLLGGLLPAIISGAALTEGIFNWPGMGRLYLEAASTRDYPLLLAIISIATVATLLGTLMADVAYGYVDPRVRYG
jgi:peptide/nickel transport system permease protein